MKHNYDLRGGSNIGANYNLSNDTPLPDPNELDQNANDPTGTLYDEGSKNLGLSFLNYYISPITKGTKNIANAVENSMRDNFTNELRTSAESLEDNCPALTYKIGNRDVQFTLNTGDNTMTYDWDFGDGNTDISFEPTIIHRYNIEGTYNATVDVYDKNDNFLIETTQSVTISLQGAWSFAAQPISDVDYLSGLLTFAIRSTTKSGFIYETTWNAPLGTCYSNGLNHFNCFGTSCPQMIFYNCTANDLLPSDPIIPSVIPPAI